MAKELRGRTYINYDHRFREQLRNVQSQRLAIGAGGTRGKVYIFRTCDVRYPFLLLSSVYLLPLSFEVSLDPFGTDLLDTSSIFCLLRLFWCIILLHIVQLL